MRKTVLGGVWAAAVVGAAFSCSSPNRDFGSKGAAGGGSGGSAGVGATGASAGELSGSSNAGATNAGGADQGGTDSGGDAAGAADPGGPLTVVSVTPDARTATTRDVVSVTFSRPVTQDSASAGISIRDSRGDVVGNLALSGSVATFEPRGSLCFDQQYQVSVATSVQTADGQALQKAASFQFSIPDGAWGTPQPLDAESSNSFAIGNLAMDQDGNALATWQVGATGVPALSYYDTALGTWSARQDPAFTAPRTSSYGRTSASLKKGHAVAVFPGFGIAERSASGTWTVSPESAIVGTANFFENSGLALANNGAAMVVWDNQNGYDPGNVFAAIQATASGAWVPPTDVVSGAWSIAETVHALPDDSFMVIYDKRPSAGVFGNIAVQRYQPSMGWSGEHPLAAGGSPIATHNNFGDLFTIGGNGTPVFSYSYAADHWQVGPDLPPVVNMSMSLALAGDGGAFCFYQENDYDNHVFRVLVRRLVANAWTPEIELRTSTTANPSLTNIVADDCGDAEVLWIDGTSLYARRYTPASGWSPTLFITTTPGPGSEQGTNGRGESVFGLPIPGTATNSYRPAAIRFQ